MRGCLRIKEVHNRNTIPWSGVSESDLNERRSLRSYSLLTLQGCVWGGGGRYSQVFLHVDLDQASTVYRKKYQRYQAYPKNELKATPNKIIQFCILTLNAGSQLCAEALVLQLRYTDGLYKTLH